MDERKPTYKELLEENERQYKDRRFNDTYRSMMGCIIAVISFCCIYVLARYGLIIYLVEANATLEWAKFCLFVLTVGGLFIGVYLIWHFVFVLCYNYEDEINNFIKHWRKTKESIKEEDKFNPPA